MLEGQSQAPEDSQATITPSESRRLGTQRTQVKVSLKTQLFSIRALTKSWSVIIVTSQWHYSRDSQLKTQDKDFKRLNKSALGNRATTAHVSGYWQSNIDSLVLYITATILLPLVVWHEDQTSNSAKRNCSEESCGYEGRGQHQIRWHWSLGLEEAGSTRLDSIRLGCRFHLWSSPATRYTDQSRSGQFLRWDPRIWASSEGTWDSSRGWALQEVDA